MSQKHFTKSKLVLLALVAATALFLVTERHSIVRLYDGFSTQMFAKDHQHFYLLKTNENVSDITDILKYDSKIPLSLRKPLLEGTRRIYVFRYQSDGLPVAGYLSLINDKKSPTVLFLRGGNGTFGIMRPNNYFSYLDGYNVIGTLYRGNIYGGIDEFGGSDINDVENLIKFIPQLQQAIQSEIQPPFAMIGISRGALEMFGALAKSNLVKKTIKKAISVSGNTDLDVTVKERPEMKYMLKSKFQEQEQIKNFQDWLNVRNPSKLTSLLNKNLSVLMVYGLKDNRVALSEQTNFMKVLDKNFIKAKFVTLENADHGMNEDSDHVKNIIVKFLNSNA